MDLAQELDTAVAAVREAASLCRAVQAGLTVDPLRKGDRSPVTVADFGSQALVCRRLKAAFPEDPVVAEEASAMLRDPANRAAHDEVLERVRMHYPDATSAEVLGWIDHGTASGQTRRFWTIDPIDGTKGFVRGDQYAIALALIIDGAVRVGVLGCPNLEGGTIYAAVAGAGTRCLHEGEKGERVQVSTTAIPSEARFCESVVSEHSDQEEAAAVASYLGITAPPLRMDSQAKYAVVASGGADIYLRLPRPPGGYVENIWDHAAGMLVVTEAGGRVTDIHGRALDFSHGARLEANEGIVATNGYLHAEVLNALT